MYTCTHSKKSTQCVITAVHAFIWVKTTSTLQASVTTGVATNNIYKSTTGDRSHCFNGFSDGGLNTVPPVHYGHDTCHFTQNNNGISYHLSSGLPSVQHWASTVMLCTETLTAEWTISVHEEETEDQGRLVQENCQSETESSKLWWIPHPPTPNYPMNIPLFGSED